MSWVRQSGRLAMYGASADSAFWTEQWRHTDRAKLLRQAQRDVVLRGAFLRHLPRHGRILEAGAGLGQWVEILRDLGYNVEGVEWSAPAVEAALATRPDLPLSVGDIMRLERSDGTYAAIICLGVAEHLPEGPGELLRELGRVLMPGGTLMLSVPHLGPLRRLKAALGRYPDKPPPGLLFYQYAYAPVEFIGLLNQAGFSVMEMIPYDSLLGLRSELSLLNTAYDRFYRRGQTSSLPSCVPSSFNHSRGQRLGWRVGRWLFRTHFLRWFAGHMMLYVCRKGLPPSIC